MVYMISYLATFLVAIGIFMIILIPKSRILWVWTIFWAIALYLTWYPELFNIILVNLRIERFLDLDLGVEFLLVYLCILLILFLILSMDSRLNRITREIMHLFASRGDVSIETVSLIAPAWNEEENIELLAEELVKSSEKLPLNWEVLLVNDGSKDNTGKICDEMAEKYPNVRAIHHEVNKGKTAAFETGVRESKSEIVVLIESDRQYDPKDLLTLLQPFRDGFDFVNGWRLVRSDRFHRRLFSGTYNALQRSLFGTHFRDHNSGYKAFKRNTILSILDALKRVKLGGPHRFFLVMGETLGYHGAEMPVQHFDRIAGTSYINPLKTPFRTFLDIIKLRLLLSYRKKRVFGSTTT